MDEQKDMPGPAHMPGTRKGEELKDNEGKEPGRHETGSGNGTDRPAGKSTARDSTSISPEAEEAIDPASPHLPAP